MSTAVLGFIRTGVLTRVRSFTNYMFRKHLMTTNVVISISLSALGDTIEQHYEILMHEHEAWDKRRTFHMSLSGMSVGVVCHHWYKYLDKALPGRTLGVVMKKVLLDQFIASPLTISTFFVTLAIVEQSSWENLKSEVKQKAWRLYAAEWVVWPPAQIINFCFLPLRYRVLYDNTISLGYDIYTSHVRHDKSTTNVIDETTEDIVCDSHIVNDKTSEDIVCEDQ